MSNTQFSYKFHGSSSNIVKDHMIEKESLSRRASQQLSHIILKNKRSRSKFLLILKCVSFVLVGLLFYLQFNQGSSINKLMNSNLQFDHKLISRQRKELLEVKDLNKPCELLDSIITLINKNQPIFTDPIEINKDKLNFANTIDPNTILTQDRLQDEHFIKLNQQQENILQQSHSNFFIDIYSKMHNLIKLFHNHLELNNNGLIIYNKFNSNFEESIIMSRITIDSIWKTNSNLPVQVVFHHIQDEENEDFKKLCFLKNVQCLHLQTESLRETYPHLTDSFLSKIAILVGNKFDKLIMIESGSILLNKIDEILKLDSHNLIFWSELNDKRVTLPQFYSITANNNVYGSKRERIRSGKDETFKYFAPTSEEQVPFHDLEDTMVDSTTDSSILFINKKTNLSILILSMYYDFYNSIYYPLIMGKLPQPLLPPQMGLPFSVLNNSTMNSLTETLILSSHVSSNKYYQVFKRQESINNGVLNFNPIHDFKLLNKFYNTDLKKIIPNSMDANSVKFDQQILDNYMNKDLDIKPVLLSNINYNEIFNKEKFFNNVFDHDFYLNNNDVDPDLILSDLILNLKKIV